MSRTGSQAGFYVGDPWLECGGKSGGVVEWVVNVMERDEMSCPSDQAPRLIRRLPSMAEPHLNISSPLLLRTQKHFSSTNLKPMFHFEQKIPQNQPFLPNR